MNEYNTKIIEQTKNYIELNKTFPNNFIKNHKNLFYIAALNNEKKLIEVLIEKIKKENENILGELINHLTENGATPLHYFVYNGNKEMVDLLCKNGANPNYKANDGESALELAKRKLRDYTEIVKKLELYNKKPIPQKLYIKRNLYNNNKNKYYKKIDNDIFKSIKPKGLNNIKGSCYINSVLQCLFHIKPLSLYILNEENNLNNKPFIKSYFTIVSGLAQKIQSSESISPLLFKTELEKNNPDYGSDPKDIILDFFYYTNKELLGDENSIQLSNKINKCNKKELFEYYKDEFERTKTKISELFCWFKQIKRKCNHCRETTYDFINELYFIFNLEKVCNNTKNKNYYLKLIDCFKDYFKIKNDIFTCQNCNTKKSGTLENRICVLPKYLIIILDRGKNDKFNCRVDFEQYLDLDEVTEQIENEKYNSKYELIGVTFLQGSSGTGHTVAFCKHFDNKYYLFNDSNYNQEKLDNLKYSYKAFLLFYERINN